MSKNNSRINTLLRFFFGRYISGKSSAKEILFIKKFYDSLDTKPNESFDLDSIGIEIKSNIDHRIDHNQSILIKRRYYFAAAASILITFGFLIHFYINPSQINKNIISKELLKTKEPLMAIGNDEVYSLLDTIPLGAQYITIDNEQVLDVTNLEFSNSQQPILITNPSNTPFAILLPDGSQLWLNQDASIRYQSDYGDHNRIIEMKGEVFFDVQKKLINNHRVPFIVKTHLQTIEVLGTKFNVNANDLQEENVELLEGSIQLSHNIQDKIIRMQPGEHAYLNQDQANIFVLSNRNGNKANAWRKGLFYFENENMTIVSKELSQWYDQEIKISDSVKELPITGVFTRYKSILEVLSMIELTNNINYEERKGIIYVKSKNE